MLVKELRAVQQGLDSALLLTRQGSAGGHSGSSGGVPFSRLRPAVESFCGGQSVPPERLQQILHIWPEAYRVLQQEADGEILVALPATGQSSGENTEAHPSVRRAGRIVARRETFSQRLKELDGEALNAWVAATVTGSPLPHLPSLLRVGTGAAPAGAAEATTHASTSSGTRRRTSAATLARKRARHASSTASSTSTSASSQQEAQWQNDPLAALQRAAQGPSRADRERHTQCLDALHSHFVTARKFAQPFDDLVHAIAAECRWTREATEQTVLALTKLVPAYCWVSQESAAPNRGQDAQRVLCIKPGTNFSETRRTVSSSTRP